MVISFRDGETSLMGSWGAGAFENDSALDWLAELESQGVSALRSILLVVAETDEADYVDVDDGAGAIAAAEVVAAALGRGRERVTPQVLAWLDVNAGAIRPDDMDLARRAVVRVMAPSSELNELQKDGEDARWEAEVRVLFARLDGDASTLGRERNSPRVPAGKKQQERMKLVLLTFLRARGLEPSDEEMARIDSSNDPEEIASWLRRVVDAGSIADLFGEKG